VAYATFQPKAGSQSVAGAATLTDMGGGTTLVVIGVSGAGAGPIAASIQTGTCPSPNPEIAFRLTDVLAGASITSVNVSLSELLAADHVINLSVAGSETESSITCGDIQPLAAP
jgi:hypothetical protein